MIYYFDTSALVKRYHREEGTEVVDKIIEGESPIYFSTIAIAETISALRKLKSMRKISRKMYEKLVGVFFGEVEKRFVIVPLDDSQILTTIKMIEKHNLRTLDALHLAVASEIKIMGDVIFVSSDKKLLLAAKKEGFGILNPEKP